MQRALSSLLVTLHHFLVYEEIRNINKMKQMKIYSDLHWNLKETNLFKISGDVIIGKKWSWPGGVTKVEKQ